ncbi:translation initiation factor IF-2-like [Gallus gallus]|uniref:translation initiation factor IF-2-like n=1 Tax=Gallus gallus TaxID=9031 RepID=UPI001AE7834B|nr:translation initiation factor IF-2-like [Gallus gallus]
MGQDVTPRAPQRRKAPAAGARPNFPVPGQNPEGGFLRPRAGHSVPKARPLPPAEPSVSPHSPTRQAAGRSPGRGGRRRPDGREAARGTATKSRGRGAPGEALQLGERERRTTQRRKEATAASASHGHLKGAVCDKTHRTERAALGSPGKLRRSACGKPHSGERTSGADGAVHEEPEGRAARTEHGRASLPQTALKLRERPKGAGSYRGGENTSVILSGCVSS